MNIKDIKTGQRVIYRRGAKGPLYEKHGEVIQKIDCKLFLKEENIYSFVVKFDYYGEYECLAENLDLEEDNKIYGNLCVHNYYFYECEELCKVCNKKCLEHNYEKCYCV